VAETPVGFRESGRMRESLTYHAILAEGFASAFAKGYDDGWAVVYAEGFAEGFIKGYRKRFLRMASDQLGPPDEWRLAAIEAIEDLGRIERLGDQLLDVTTWNELLAAP